MLQSKKVIIIATGASLTESDVDIATGDQSDKFIIAINNAYTVCPQSDVIWGGDARFWDWHYNDIWINETSRFLTISSDAAEKYNIEYVASKSGMFLNFDPERPIRQGYNSSFAALNWAILQGAKDIIFLGLDCKPGKDKTHFFGEHPIAHRSPYHLFIQAFEAAAKQLINTDIKIINCSPDSAVTCFEKKSISDAIGSRASN